MSFYTFVHINQPKGSHGPSLDWVQHFVPQQATKTAGTGVRRAKSLEALRLSRHSSVTNVTVATHLKSVKV